MFMFFMFTVMSQLMATGPDFGCSPVTTLRRAYDNEVFMRAAHSIQVMSSTRAELDVVLEALHIILPL